MILDMLEHASAYKALGAKIARGLEILESTDFASVEDGRLEFEDGIFCLVQSYETRPLTGIVAELHKKYIDIQYLVEGEENIGWLPAEQLLNAEQTAADCWKAPCEPQLVKFVTGSFGIFFPADAHAPNLSIASPGRVRKAVVKVPVN